MDQKSADAIADKRLRQHAADYLEDLRNTLHESLPGNHSPAETILLAYLMTMMDGYQPVDFRSNGWESRRKTGWGTTLGYLVSIGKILVPFILECRHDNFARQLAILIDEENPGLRTVKKSHKEAVLISVGCTVLLFTSSEIIADPDGCSERIERTLSELADNVLTDAGIIRGKPG